MNNFNDDNICDFFPTQEFTSQKFHNQNAASVQSMVQPRKWQSTVADAGNSKRFRGNTLPMPNNFNASQKQPFQQNYGRLKSNQVQLSKQNVRRSHGDNYREQSNRLFIRELNSGVVQKKLIGVVIAKFEIRGFPDKKNAGQMRYQMLFTLRDTVDDFINCTCWGQEMYMKNLAESFSIGDIVEINNIMSQLKQHNEYEEKYKPSTPSQFQLVLNEQHATLSLFCDGDFNEFSAIANVPIKESSDYYTLSDIITQQSCLNGSLVNILAAVKYIGESKNITTKAGRNMVRKEIKLFDETCRNFPVIIWDKEIAQLADTWKSKESVLFLCDVRVCYDDFRQTMVATCTSKTIIITNPDTPEAHHLFTFAQQYEDITDVNVPTANDVDVASIQETYSVNELKEKLSSPDIMFSEPFYGSIIACISSFDLDTENNRSCISIRCNLCKRKIDRVTNQCMNVSCSQYGQTIPDESLKISIEIPLCLSDHTGGLSGFMLSNDVAEKMLLCNVEEFRRKSDIELTQLKWKFLFERFKVFFKVSPPNDPRRSASLYVIQMDEIDANEIAGH